MTINQLFDSKPETTVMCECGDKTVELPVETLAENGYGDRDLTNPENAGPFLPVSAEELQELSSL